MISDRLKHLRVTLGLNQSDFGEKIGVTKSAISTFETGTRAVTDRNIMALCKEYGVKEDWLRTGNGDMFNKPDNLFELFGYASSDMSDLERKILKNYLSLTKEEREAALNFIVKLSQD